MPDRSGVSAGPAGPKIVDSASRAAKTSAMQAGRRRAFIPTPRVAFKHGRAAAVNTLCISRLARHPEKKTAADRQRHRASHSLPHWGARGHPKEMHHGRGLQVFASCGMLAAQVGALEKRATTEIAMRCKVLGLAGIAATIAAPALA